MPAPDEIMSEFFRLMTRQDGEGVNSWRMFHEMFRQRYEEFSTALNRNVPEDQLIPLLQVMLIPVVRNAFATAERCWAFFKVAESMGVHIMPAHYHSPAPDTRLLPDSLFTRRFDDLPGWSLDGVSQLALLAELSRYRQELNGIPRERREQGEFYWDNPALGDVDAAIYYTMIRHFRPHRVLEVGAGYSTMIAAKACVANRDATVLEAIEPYPMEALSRGFPGLRKLTVSPLQEVPLAEFETLGENDILFVDSSHVCKIGSDLHYLFFSILPRLRSGVLIHFHDIFLPLEYDRTWVVDRQHFWNEQYLLLAFLLFNREFEIVLSAMYLGLDHRERLAEAFPLLRSPGGGSIWIRRR